MASSKSEMLHVRIDSELKSQALETLGHYGLSISEAVRILLTKIVNEGGLPAPLIMSEQAYDEWFRAKVHEAIDSPYPRISHELASERLLNAAK